MIWLHSITQLYIKSEINKKNKLKPKNTLTCSQLFVTSTQPTSQLNNNPLSLQLLDIHLSLSLIYLIVSQVNYSQLY